MPCFSRLGEAQFNERACPMACPTPCLNHGWGSVVHVFSKSFQACCLCGNRLLPKVHCRPYTPPSLLLCLRSMPDINNAHQAYIPLGALAGCSSVLLPSQLGHTAYIQSWVRIGNWVFCHTSHHWELMGSVFLPGKGFLSCLAGVLGLLPGS